MQRIQPVQTLAIDRESRTTQKNMNAWITVTNTSCRDVINPRRKHRVELARVGLVVERRCIYLQEATRSSCADLKSCDEKADAVALLRRLYSFFCDDLLKHLTIEAQIRDKPFELRVFFPKLPQFAYFGSSKIAISLLPELKRIFMDSHFTDDIGD